MGVEVLMERGQGHRKPSGHNKILMSPRWRGRSLSYVLALHWRLQKKGWVAVCLDWLRRALDDIVLHELEEGQQKYKDGARRHC